MKQITLMIVALILGGCAGAQPRLQTVDRLELNRFMGKWYVIACIPVFIEAKAYNEIESYQIFPDGSIDTVLTFNQGSFTGPLKRYNPRGFVVDKINNSTWKMQFIWPFKAEYLITYINDDYSVTIVSRNKRDYVWIMARKQQISQSEYDRLVGIIRKQGYRIEKLRKVPQEKN